VSPWLLRNAINNSISRYHPIFPLSLILDLIDLFMPTLMGWHKYVQPGGMWITSIPSDWIRFMMLPIMW